LPQLPAASSNSSAPQALGESDYFAQTFDWLLKHHMTVGRRFQRHLTRHKRPPAPLDMAEELAREEAEKQKQTRRKQKQPPKKTEL
jgi:hypothetical protein